MAFLKKRSYAPRYLTLCVLAYLHNSTVLAETQTPSGTTVLEPITVVDKMTLNPPNSKPQLDVQTQTGSRLGLTSRETPASITVIDEVTIQQRGAQTTQEALERAPGVTISSQPGSAGSVSMRGFTGAQITQLFNGLTVQYDVVAARPIDSWLMERVEVLGGPSSFLYGQGAVGGSINYVSKVAQREKSHHKGMLILGEYLNRRASYDYNGQLGDSKNWFRGVVSYLGTDGFMDHTGANSGVVSLSLLSDITDKLTNTIAFEHQLEDRDAYWGTPILNPRVNGRIIPWGDARLNNTQIKGQIDQGTRFKNYNSKDPVFDQQVTWGRDILEYQFDKNTQIKNTLYVYKGDRQYENVEGYDWNATNSAVLRGMSFAVNHNQTLVGNRIELNNDSKVFDLPLKTLVGIDVAYNRQVRANSTEPYNFATNANPRLAGLVSTVNPYDFTVGTYWDKPGASGPIRNRRNELMTVSGFMENRLTLMPDLNLVTGLRVDDIDLESRNYRTPTPPSAANPFGEPARFHRHWTAVTWRAGLMYDISPSLNVYTQYSTAASPPAGILTTATLGNLRSFDLSTGRQAEIGSKFDFWNKRGSGTIAAYWIERNNMTTPDPNNPQSVLPVGAQSSVGVEANLGLQITPQWAIQGNMAYTDAQYDDFSEVVGGRNVSRAGNQPTNVPKWTANAWLTWSFHPDWQWGGGVRYVGNRFVDNANTIILPEFAVYDMQMSWKPIKHTLLTARVKNLTDKVYSEWGSGGSAPLFLLREPRTFQMEVKLDF
jgi:iron complex outermembrane recepter protein